MRASILAGAIVAVLASAAPAHAAGQTTDRTVSFAVTNVNQTTLSCGADGARYTVHGSLVMPAGAPPSSVTLYLHGLGFGAFFWRFNAVSGYDYALEQAKAGHASVVIDRLGYDSSGHPVGTADCIGSQATVAHQVVQALRHGTYTVGDDAEPGPSFARVALAGHSLGGLLAQDEAATFHDVDAVAVLAYSDLVPSLQALQTFGRTTVDCVLGGGPAEGPGSPGGYAPFGETASDFDAIMFHDAEQGVIDATNRARNVDPCGDTSSVPYSLVQDPFILGSITVPVLFALGDSDALFTPPLAGLEANEFTGTKDLTKLTFADTGHAITLGRSAPAVRAAIGGWLTAHGF